MAEASLFGFRRDASFSPNLPERAKLECFDNTDGAPLPWIARTGPLMSGLKTWRLARALSSLQFRRIRARIDTISRIGSRPALLDCRNKCGNDDKYMKHNQSVIRGFIPRIRVHRNIDGFDIKPDIRGFNRGIHLQRSEIPPDFAKTGNAQQNAERSGRRVRMGQ